MPDDLKSAFPNIEPFTRDSLRVKNKNIPHKSWLSGFTDGEGSFKVIIYKKPTIKIGYRVALVFQLTQHNRDTELFNSILNYFECGKLEKDNRGPYLNFSVYKFEDNYEKIIPFFKENKLAGNKLKDFNDWCRIA